MKDHYEWKHLIPVLADHRCTDRNFCCHPNEPKRLVLRLNLGPPLLKQKWMILKIHNFLQPLLVFFPSKELFVDTVSGIFISITENNFDRWYVTQCLILPSSLYQQLKIVIFSTFWESDVQACKVYRVRKKTEVTAPRDIIVEHRADTEKNRLNVIWVCYRYSSKKFLLHVRV